MNIKANGKPIEVVFRDYKLPMDFPLVALTGDNWNSKPAPVTRMHFHNCTEIGILKEGCGQVFSASGTYSIDAPAILIVPENTIHFTAARYGKPCRWNWLYTNISSMLVRLSREAQEEVFTFMHELDGGVYIISGIDYPSLYQLLVIICDQLSGKANHYREAVRGLLSAAVLMLPRFSQKNNAEQQDFLSLTVNIKPAINYINQYFNEQIRIDTLAKLCHISASHFRRVFKSVYGISPTEHIQNVRISHACEMLYNCENSVMSIGEQVGFSSATSFDRQFTKRYGVPSQKWRKKIHSEENTAVTDFLNADNKTEENYQ